MSNKNNRDIIEVISAMAISSAIKNMAEQQGLWSKSILKDDKAKEDNSTSVSECDFPACSVEAEFLQPSDSVPAGRILVINRLMRSAERLRSLKQIDSETTDRLSWMMAGIADPKLSVETFSSIVNDVGTLLDTEFSTLKPDTPNPIDRQYVLNDLRGGVEFVLSRPNLTETNRLAINALMSAVSDSGTSTDTLSECVIALHRIIVQVKRYS